MYIKRETRTIELICDVCGKSTGEMICPDTPTAPAEGEPDYGWLALDIRGGIYAVPKNYCSTNCLHKDIDAEYLIFN